MAGKPGRSGRKPKPVALRIANGQSLPSGAVNAPAGRIEPPDWLDPVEKADFLRLTANVARIDGLLSPVDVELFTKHAVIYGRWRRAREAITDSLTRDGAHGGQVVAGEVGVMERAERLLLSIEQELGLTPSSRSRLKTNDQAGEDEFDRLMREHA